MAASMHHDLDSTHEVLACKYQSVTTYLAMSQWCIKQGICQIVAVKLRISVKPRSLCYVTC